MTLLVDNPFVPLSFIAGPAILMNACAIMQNGATLRYNLAIPQWREFRASLAARDGRLSTQYPDPAVAMSLAERRLRLQLRGLKLLNVAVALFGATTVLALAGAFLGHGQAGLTFPIILIMVGAGGAGLVFLLAATVTFFFESACAGTLLRLHLQVGEPVPTSSG